MKKFVPSQLLIPPQASTTNRRASEAAEVCPRETIFESPRIEAREIYFLMSQVQNRRREYDSRLMQDLSRQTSMQCPGWFFYR
jgi:hypothetical protein